MVEASNLVGCGSVGIVPNVVSDSSEAIMTVFNLDGTPMVSNLFLAVECQIPIGIGVSCGVAKHLSCDEHLFYM